MQMKRAPRTSYFQIISPTKAKKTCVRGPFLSRFNVQIMCKIGLELQQTFVVEVKGNPDHSIEN